MLIYKAKGGSKSRYEGTKKAGKFEGRVKASHSSSGNQGEFTYKDGIAEGPYTIYAPDGSKTTGEYRNNKKQDSATTYFKNGAIMRLFSLKDDDFTKCCYSTKDGRKHSGILDKNHKKWKWTALDKGDRVYFTPEKKSGDVCVIKGIIVAAGKKISDVEITESCDSHYQARTIKKIDNCLLFSRD